MTQDEIIEMAKEAGIIFGWPAYHDRIEVFAKLVATKEREACAMECIKKANAWTQLGAWGSNNEFHQCAEAIRARSISRGEA